jgi:hypothetical protein
MLEPFQYANGFQNIGKDNYDAMFRSYVEWNKGLQVFATRMAAYSKQAFQDGTRAFEQLVDAKSLGQALEIQSQYAKKAYDNWVAETSKLSEMYTDMVRSAYKPAEELVAKRVS